MKMTLIVLASAALLASCGGNAQKKAADGAAQATETVDMHNAENALDYAGVYKGTIPAADCPGIEVTLTLKADGTYTEHDKYLERDSEFDDEGGYSVVGNLLTLTPASGEGVTYYKVGENKLFRLDADKQPIAGELADQYTLTKTTE